LHMESSRRDIVRKIDTLSMIVMMFIQAVAAVCIHATVSPLTVCSR